MLVETAKLKPTKPTVQNLCLVNVTSEFEMIKVARSVFQGMINDDRFFKCGFVAPVIFRSRLQGWDQQR